MADGDIITRSASYGAGTLCFVRVRTGERSTEGLTLVSDLLDAKGETVAHHEKDAPTINVDIPIELSSDLPQGQYELSLTLQRRGQKLSSTVRRFFLVNHPAAIEGILSYPLVVFPSRTALLIADIDAPAGLDPFLKWTYGKKVLASGRLRDGYDQILWESPGEEGVYSIGVEVFPFPPASGADFPFTSPIKAAAELYISTKESGKPVTRKASLRYSLFDIYISSLRERERFRENGGEAAGDAAAVQMRRPVPVILGDDIGMKFDGESGFTFPEFIFPLAGKTLMPFTIRLGVKFEGVSAGGGLLAAKTGDGSLEMKILFDENGELALALKTKNTDALFPSGIAKPQTGVRLLIEASVLPVGGSLRVSWRLNDAPTSQAEKAVMITAADRQGRTLIGGPHGVRCSIDTLEIMLN